MRIPYITTPTGLGATADRLATRVNDATTIASMAVVAAEVLAQMAFHGLGDIISGKGRSPISQGVSDFDRLTPEEQASVRGYGRKGFL